MAISKGIADRGRWSLKAKNPGFITLERNIVVAAMDLAYF
jgi:hypothetical protein